MTLSGARACLRPITCVRWGEKWYLIDSLLVRIHCIIVMIRWTGLAPWEFKSLFSGSLTFKEGDDAKRSARVPASHNLCARAFRLSVSHSDSLSLSLTLCLLFDSLSASHHLYTRALRLCLFL